MAAVAYPQRTRARRRSEVSVAARGARASHLRLVEPLNEPFDDDGLFDGLTVPQAPTLRPRFESRPVPIQRLIVIRPEWTTGAVEVEPCDRRPPARECSARPRAAELPPAPDSAVRPRRVAHRRPASVWVFRV